MPNEGRDSLIFRRRLNQTTITLPYASLIGVITGHVRFAEDVYFAVESSHLRRYSLSLFPQGRRISPKRLGLYASGHHWRRHLHNHHAILYEKL